MQSNIVVKKKPHQVNPNALIQKKPSETGRLFLRPSKMPGFSKAMEVTVAESCESRFQWLKVEAEESENTAA